MLSANLRFDAIESYVAELNDVDMNRVNDIYSRMEKEASESMHAQGYQGKVGLTRSSDMRYVGQNYEVRSAVPSGKLEKKDLSTMITNFNKEHRKLYGHAKSDEPIELVNLVVTAFGILNPPRLMKVKPGINARAAAKGSREVFFEKEQRYVKCAVYERDRLGAGAKFPGPAIVEEMDSTTVINPGQSATVDQFGNLLVKLQ
jgi:N-methylhydantoinase A